MDLFDEYIRKANLAIASGDAKHIDEVAREICGAFADVIPKIGSYRGSRVLAVGSPDPHTKEDLKKLVGRLRVFRAERDSKLYADCGLESISNDINTLRDLLCEEFPSERADGECHSIDDAYANEIEGYICGLRSWANSKVRESTEQVELRLRRLELYRGKLYREHTAARVPQVVASANAQAQAQANASLEAAITNVGELPSSSLSDEDKEALRNMLTQLFAAQGGHEKNSKLQQVLRLLADKGIDVAVAVLPYVLRVIGG